jgi:uncharacterized protein YcbK (DUF882 family)
MTPRIARALPFLLVLAPLVLPSGVAHGEPTKPAARPQPARHSHPAPARTSNRGKKTVQAAPKPYVQAMVGWHAPVTKAAPVDAEGRPLFVLYSINRNERIELTPLGDHGGFSARDLDRVSHLLRAASGDEHPIDPRILDLVYRIQRQFHAPEIRVVSGYRTPKPGSRSNHGKGRAIDFIVPGTPDEDVAKLAREIGYTGVGIYPTSQFVHVDIRPRSYFWVDYSAPGKKNRERGIFGDLAAHSDQAAAARGDSPIEPFGIGSDVDAALRARGAVAPVVADEDDDDGDG